MSKPKTPIDEIKAEIISRVSDLAIFGNHDSEISERTVLGNHAIIYALIKMLQKMDYDWEFKLELTKND